MIFRSPASPDPARRLKSMLFKRILYRKSMIVRSPPPFLFFFAFWFPRHSNACWLVKCSGLLALHCAGRRADHLVAPSVSLAIDRPHWPLSWPGACRICAEEVQGLSAVLVTLPALAIELAFLRWPSSGPGCVDTTFAGAEWSHASIRTAGHPKFLSSIAFDSPRLCLSLAVKSTML